MRSCGGRSEMTRSDKIEKTGTGIPWRTKFLSCKMIHRPSISCSHLIPKEKKHRISERKVIQILKTSYASPAALNIPEASDVDAICWEQGMGSRDRKIEIFKCLQRFMFVSVNEVVQICRCICFCTSV